MQLFNLKTAPGLSIGDQVLPMRFKKILPEGAKEADLEDLIVKYPTEMRSPRNVRPNLLIETNASAELILQWVSKMLNDWGMAKGFLQIKTKAGRVFELPD